MDLKVTVKNAFNETCRNIRPIHVAGVVFTAIAFGFGYRYLQKPKKVTRVGVVSQLIIYPMKSGKGMRVNTAECPKMGLKSGDLKDRHWLIITEDGRQVTGRQEPRLVLVTLVSEGGELCLNGPGMEELRIPLTHPDNPVVTCRVFSDDIQGRDCGDQASLWLTRYLDSGNTIRLVQYESDMSPRRPVERVPVFDPNEKVVYPDIAPVNLLSEASVADLNTRLEHAVTVAQFRPNIVVSGCDAYAEDSWNLIQIGNVQLQRVMSCTRCIFTTVDPDTGIIDRIQPLETLKSYRLCDPSEKELYKSSPLFGQYYSVKRSGVFQVGDPVYIMSR